APSDRERRPAACAGRAAARLQDGEIRPGDRARGPSFPDRPRQGRILGRPRLRVVRRHLRVAAACKKATQRLHLRVRAPIKGDWPDGRSSTFRNPKRRIAEVHDTASIYNAVPDNDTLGGRLLRAREATGLSLKELADRLGVRPATVQAWENDRSQPRANRMQMMAGLLNVSLSWLLHGIGSGPSGDGHAELLESLALQLDRLKRLQHESQQLATRIERDMRRFAAGSHV